MAALSDLTDAELREWALHFHAHEPLTDRVKTLTRFFIALRNAARAEQRERDAKLVDERWNWGREWVIKKIRAQEVNRE